MNKSVIFSSLCATCLCFGMAGGTNPLPGSPRLAQALADPQTKPEWKAWVQANHQAVRSLNANDTDYADLQFLKPLIEEKRAVQLGESGHGVSEFNKAKVRLIKFLHEECGFDVMAFESGIFECHLAGLKAASTKPVETMVNSIFAVWHCQEALELFNYIHSTWSTDRPLMLEGFDIQTSSYMGSKGRPAVFKKMVGLLDPVYAEMINEKDIQFIDNHSNPSWLKEHRSAHKTLYNELASWLDENMEALSESYPEEPTLPLVLRQTAWSLGQYVEIRAENNMQKSENLRDAGMAANVNFILDQLHPQSKVIIWAHNYHIQYDPTLIPGSEKKFSMGWHLAKVRRPELYTIGFFMYEGKAADNNRQIYDIKVSSPNSLEATLFYTGKPFSFVNLSDQKPNSGNSWMFEYINAFDWGRSSQSQIISREYDGLFFVKSVNPPAYLR